MKILWITFNTITIEEAGETASTTGTGGWVNSMLSALRRFVGDLDITVLGIGLRRVDFEKCGVRYISLGMRPPLANEVIPRKIIKRVSAVVNDVSPDVIHLHGTEFFYSALPKGTFNGVPVVVSLQGLISELHVHMSGGLSWSETFWNHLNFRLLCKCQTIFSDQKFWRRYRAPLEQQALVTHDYFIGRTDFDKAVLRYYNDGARYFHVDEVLRPEFYESTVMTRKPYGRTIFCGAAADYPLKGVHWLLRAVAPLRRKYPDVRIRIASAMCLSPNRSLVSRVKDFAYHSYLRELIVHLRLGDMIEYTPPLDAVGMRTEMLKASLLVLPSLCENSSNTIAEAMLCKTPVIANYTGGNPAIIRNGVDGVLVPPYDSFALLQAIENAFENPDEMMAMAVNAYELARVRHDPKNNAEKLRDVYAIISSERKEH